MNMLINIQLRGKDHELSLKNQHLESSTRLEALNRRNNY